MTALEAKLRWAAFWGDDRSDLYKLARDFAAKKMGYSYSANSYLELLLAVSKRRDGRKRRKIFA